MMDIYNVIIRIEREMQKRYPDWQVVQAMQKNLKEYSEKVTQKLMEVE
jgi:hypothetical protein